MQPLPTPCNKADFIISPDGSIQAGFAVLALKPKTSTWCLAPDARWGPQVIVQLQDVAQLTPHACFIPGLGTSYSLPQPEGESVAKIRIWAGRAQSLVRDQRKQSLQQARTVFENAVAARIIKTWNVELIARLNQTDDLLADEPSPSPSSETFLAEFKRKVLSSPQRQSPSAQSWRAGVRKALDAIEASLPEPLRKAFPSTTLGRRGLCSYAAPNASGSDTIQGLYEQFQPGQEDIERARRDVALTHQPAGDQLIPWPVFEGDLPLAGTGDNALDRLITIRSGGGFTSIGEEGVWQGDSFTLFAHDLKAAYPKPPDTPAKSPPPASTASGTTGESANSSASEEESKEEEPAPAPTPSASEGDTVVFLKGAAIAEQQSAIAESLGLLINIVATAPKFGPIGMLSLDRFMREEFEAEGPPLSPAPAACTLKDACLDAFLHDRGDDRIDACATVTRPESWVGVCRAANLVAEESNQGGGLLFLAELGKLLEDENRYLSTASAPSRARLDAALEEFYTAYLTPAPPTVIGLPSARKTSRVIQSGSVEGGFRYEARICRDVKPCDASTAPTAVVASTRMEARKFHEFTTVGVELAWNVGPSPLGGYAYEDIGGTQGPDRLYQLRGQNGIQEKLTLSTLAYIFPLFHCRSRAVHGFALGIGPTLFNGSGPSLFKQWNMRLAYEPTVARGVMLSSGVSARAISVPTFIPEGTIVSVVRSADDKEPPVFASKERIVWTFTVGLTVNLSIVTGSDEKVQQLFGDKEDDKEGGSK